MTGPEHRGSAPQGPKKSDGSTGCAGWVWLTAASRAVLGSGIAAGDRETDGYFRAVVHIPRLEHPTHLGDDAIADGQPQSGPVADLLGGEERLELDVMTRHLAAVFRNTGDDPYFLRRNCSPMSESAPGPAPAYFRLA